MIHWTACEVARDHYGKIDPGWYVVAWCITVCVVTYFRLFDWYRYDQARLEYASRMDLREAYQDKQVARYQRPRYRPFYAHKR